MLRVALQGQIGALKDKKYLQDCEKTLLTELERKLINIST